MLPTPTGNDVKNWMKQWSFVLAEDIIRNQLNVLMDGQGLLIFFEFDKEIFGATEANRVTFAKMKSPSPEDDEADDAWRKDAHFSALNLSRAITGKPMQQIFYMKDIGLIKVLSKEEATNKLISSIMQPTEQ